MSATHEAEDDVIDGRQRTVALLVAACFFMENLDGTIVTTSAGAMARSLGVPVGSMGLVVSSYLMTVAVLIPISGWLARRFGTRRVFLAAVAVFTLASVGAAVSTSFTALIVARIVQGLGGALMVPVGRTVVLAGSKPAQIIALVAYLTWPGLVAPAVAPLVGALVTTYASWRWLFLINVPLGVLAFSWARHVLAELADSPPGRLDWPGFVLAGAGLGAVAYAAYLVSDARAPAVASAASVPVAVVLVVVAVRHLARTRVPLVDLAVLRLRTFGVAQASLLLFCLAVDAVPFLLPLLLQQARGWPAVRAGTVVLLVFVGNLLAKPTTTALLNRCGFRGVLVVSGLGVAATTAVLGWAGALWPLPVIAAIALGNGALRSVGFTGYNTVALAEVSAGRMADANTLAAAARQLGAALAVALAGVALRGGRVLGQLTGASGHAMPYLVAFVAVAVPAALAAGTIALRLPAGSGDNLRTTPSGKHTG